MSTPQIPPRPSRSQASEAASASAAAPSVPPRPTNKRNDQSESPRGTHYPRSPLNESPFHPHGGEAVSDLQKLASLNASRSSVDLPQRPPSVSLPSIGQEGIEYDAGTPQIEGEEIIEGVHNVPIGSPTHTRKVSHDLPLHAPRPSLSSSEAKQRVAAVVRTDSNAAAVAASTGTKSVSLAEKPLRSKPSFNRPASSSSYDRPGSSYEDEHGIPSFGRQVPLAAQYGDVQAPSPAPGHNSQPNTPGTPGFERPSSSKHHQRTKSGRNSFQAPPGSYGLHGHGVYENVDNFEKAWLQKHPEVLREEIAAHSPAIIDRRDYNLTPEQLNKIVRASKQGGFGTSGGVSMPDEQIGYMASEAYASRNATPKPSASDQIRPAALHGAHPDIPLRNPSLSGQLAGSELASGLVHVGEPLHKESKHIGRGQAAEQEHVDLGPAGGAREVEGGWINESGYGVPILASDEIDPSNAYLHPAVPPLSDSRRGSYVSIDEGSKPNSRPSSRPGSIHNIPVLHKAQSRSEYEYHPLEDVREYEPLFPEEDPANNKFGSAADRFKQRPDMKQRFPSKDIWEDAPASVNLEAEVDTPEPDMPQFTKPTFETAEQEASRKGEISEADKARLLTKEQRLAQSSFKPHILSEVRPSLMQQRFPSRDIWEDTPDSAYMTTTVGEDDFAQEEEEDEGIEAGAVVKTSSVLPREGATAGAPAVQPSLEQQRPSIPPRPVRGKSPGKEERAPPAIPLRPAQRLSPVSGGAGLPPSSSNAENAKPAVPARPSKFQPTDQITQPEMSSLSSDREVGADSSSKAKPQVPSRPVGNKIAALQAGFMSDLNKKLGLGPQAIQQKSEQAEEEKAEEEKKPLEDARKGRARGPARRKPASSPSATATAAASAGKTEPRKFVASSVMNLFDISPEGALNAAHADRCLDQLSSLHTDSGSATTTLETPPAVGFNAQGEAVHVPAVTEEAVKLTSRTESVPALQAEAEISGEPADVGHAMSSVAGGSAQIATAIPGTSVNRETTLDAQNKGASSLPQATSGTQTGEMNIVMDKHGAKPMVLSGFKNGSVHHEGMAFVAEEDAPSKQVPDP